MNAQEIFNAVATHLLDQNVVSRDLEGCYYRHPNGKLMCAVGCLIPDNLYRPEMEFKPVHQLRNMPDWFSQNHKLLTDLQCVHDTYTPDQWSKQLVEVALKHNLEPPLPQSFCFSKG